jgi:DNA helicase-2/ATP-dependent DNA helicase PcrA
MPGPPASLTVPDLSDARPGAALAGGGDRSAAAVLDGLDPEQRTVAEALHGPVCVLAGAGTGKTRAITHRIAYGVLSGAYPSSQVLAVTFTTRAAGELRGRLRGLGVGGVQARTFHSAALRQARYFWPLVNGSDLPQLVDSKIPLVAEAAHRLRVAADRTLLRDIASEIEWSKVSNVAPVDYPAAAAAAGRQVSGVSPDQLTALLGAYAEVCRDHGRIDLEDVLLLTCALIADSPRVAAAVRSQYRHLVVDEYQDVSPLQQRLLDLWLGDSREVCVVGDPGQTIYSFAGASPRYLMGFAGRYPGAAVLRLERDYRSTPQVIAVANEVLARAPRRPAAEGGPGFGGLGAPLRLRAHRGPGPAVEFAATSDEVAEAAGVAASIKRLTTGASALAPREIAVLFRINAMSAEYESALTDAGIPYIVRGAERFFEREEVRRAVTLLRGSARAVADGARTGPGAALVEEVREVLGAVGWDPAKPPTAGRARERWESLAALDALAADTAAADPAAGLAEFVAEVAARAEAAHAPTADGVTLSSLHSAKGLEWEAVFLVGLHEGGLPLSHADTDEAIEEERRLLYVGVTRARTRLRLSWSAARSPGGRARRSRSRFLDGIAPAEPASAPGAPRAAKRVVRCTGCGKGLTVPAEIALARCDTCPAGYDDGLFERLRTWRTDTARAANVPAYVVLTDATLALVAERRPTSDAELVAISGIGSTKLEKYGADLIALCADPAGSTAAAPGSTAPPVAAAGRARPPNRQIR